MYVVVLGNITANRQQQSVSITFICTGKTKIPQFTSLQYLLSCGDPEPNPRISEGYLSVHPQHLATGSVQAPQQKYLPPTLHFICALTLYHI